MERDAESAFQSPSHREPRARLSFTESLIVFFFCFSPLLIGGRARGASITSGQGAIGPEFQSPSHRGPRARRFRGPLHPLPVTLCFSPLLIGGRARGPLTLPEVPRGSPVSVPFS